MALKVLKVRRGTSYQLSQYMGPVGEPVFNTDTKMLHMQDASTNGGIPLMKSVMPSNTIKGAITAGQAKDLTPIQVRSIINSTGWRVLEEIKLTSAVGLIDINIPDDVSMLKIYCASFFPSATPSPTVKTAILSGLVSFDGTTFLTTGQYYHGALSQFDATEPSSSFSNTNDHAIFSPGMNYGGYPVQSELFMFSGSAGSRCFYQGHVSSVSNSTGSIRYYQSLINGSVKVVGKVKKIRLADANSSNFGANTKIVVMGF